MNNARRPSKPSYEIGTASWNGCDEMNSAYDDVLLVGTFGGGGVHQYVETIHAQFDGRLETATYDMYTPPDGSGLVWFLRSLALAVWAALKLPFQPRPDIVHIHSSHVYSFYRASFYVLFAAWIWRRPVVFHIHGSSFDDFLEESPPMVQSFQALVLGQCDRVIVLSEYWHEVLRGWIDPAAIDVIPNAVDVHDYDPSYSIEPPHIVVVSNLIERKGIRELANALEKLPDTVEEPYTATIAGSGPLAPIVESLEERHPEVSYLGYVSEPDKRKLLEQGSIFVLPSHAEGLPIAILEAMAGGNAIVSTTVGGIPEVIDEANGLLVEPGDEDALYAALRDLVTDPDVVDRMSRQNRRLAIDRYGWDTVLEQVTDVYDAVYEQHRTRNRPSPQGSQRPSREKGRP